MMRNKILEPAKIITVLARGPRVSPMSAPATLLLSALALLGITAHAQQTGAAEIVETHVVTLTDKGFSQSPIRRPPGEFVLLLRNGSSLEAPTFVLERTAGEAAGSPATSVLDQRTVRRAKIRSAQLIDLPAGAYRIRVAENPAWQLRMLVKPEHDRRARKVTR